MQPNPNAKQQFILRGLANTKIVLNAMLKELEQNPNNLFKAQVEEMIEANQMAISYWEISGEEVLQDLRENVGA